MGFSFAESEATAAVLIFKFQKRLEKELDTNHIPGDLLAITSRRILWITDRKRNGESRELYGSTARYAPVAKVDKISLDTQKLQVNFQVVPSWSIPVHRIQKSAEQTKKSGKHEGSHPIASFHPAFTARRLIG